MNVFSKRQLKTKNKLYRKWETKNNNFEGIFPFLNKASIIWGRGSGEVAEIGRKFWQVSLFLSMFLDLEKRICEEKVIFK